MARRRLATTAAIAVTTVAAFTANAAPSFADQGDQQDGHHRHRGTLTWSLGTPRVDRVENGPWTLAQGDPTVDGDTVTVNGVSYPNLAVDPAGSGSVPAASGFTGTPGPLPGYCSSGGPTPETGSVLRQPEGTTLPMQPYYFPFVTSQDGGDKLTGLFDYRPKDGDEAVVAATSEDHGRTWQFAGQALEQNAGLCPDGNTNDDGQGHAFVLKVPGHGQLLYTLARPSGDRLGTNMIVHPLHPKGGNPLAGLPAAEPVGQGGSTTATAAVTVPAGPGGDGVSIAVGSTAKFEQPGHFTVDGVTVDCNDNAATATLFTGCTTRTPGGVAVKAGDPVTADAVIPAGAEQTSGLIAPDGIISTVPSYPGAPKGSTAVLYTEKIVDYFVPTTTTAAVTLPAATLPVADSTALKPAAGAGVTVSLGTPNGIVQVTCTGADATDLTGCTGGTGTVAKGSNVGAPGAATVPYAQLAKIGEGKNKPKSLYGNNEDYTVVRAAYTTDGLHFTDLGQVNGLGDPTSTSDSVLRWIGSRGTVITNPDGSYGLFLSGAYASDGDSDAFNQIFYSSSADGKNWSAPQKLLSTDYTFSALAARAAGDDLDVAGYYGGRVYDPTVVQNDNGTLTMVFAGYSTPKPLPATGSTYGTDPARLYTVPAAQPAEYRTILSVTLRPHWTK
ncbi:hypothetical protein C7C46_21330 [Streptomyces tateyamensis]|uniref:Sialidase domain-containing protein n=1 Tax=Streptomyces tateyamensis TaxID=565073 RepID=A0A2V4NY26_9ACTN|nr:hypothetical protein [Streptomyces tateyamensis]PYC76735.1 hypothetical protein C7C46_21330 [Streptomyces tateyamensis]